MAVSIIPLENLPDQSFFIDLNGQNCEIRIYLRYRYMYMDLYIDGKTIFTGAICLNNTKINQFPSDFIGELKFFDTQGTSDPYYAGFEDRWALAYVQ